MLRRTPAPLEADSAARLAQLQAQVDALPTKGERVVRATALFKNKNNAAFTDVRKKLADAASLDSACYYCERDRYRDIEHVKPKRHYPEAAFLWDNYVYSCAICNQDRKGDRFAVIGNDGKLVEFDRHSLDIDASPPAGQQVIIDLRSEDPLDFLMLDLDTGRLVPIGGPVNRLRGDWTRELFGLDEKGLVRARRQIADHILGYLERLRVALRAGETDRADRIREEVRTLPHPTVLAEMQRQSNLRPELKPLIDLL